MQLKPRLNEFQAQHVDTTFSHVDKLLTAVEALTHANSSPFARERSDVSPDEARFLTAFVQQMRARMITALGRLGIMRPEPKISARHSANVTLQFAEIALADLSASTLRGYGPVNAEAGAEAEALAADLRELIQRGRALFREEEAGKLSERLAALPGPFGEALRALERFSAEHALAEIRPLIAEAADRVAAQTFDVGVFGRVSSGKSSLINALIGMDVLPVGATPVTAVPLRLHHGELAAVVDFENGMAREITVDEISDYGTERGNPGNRAGVRAIEIAVPTVPPGLRFLDTPGIGSLSASAPAQAFAWLPRCDLGLVLIAAGTPVGADDLALVSGLANAGIECQVLISKSDLLKPEELAQSISYVRKELAAVLGDGRLIPVHAVSAIPTAESSLAAFRAAVLEPLIASHVHALHEALRARLHRLVGITRAAVADSEASANSRPREEETGTVVADVSDSTREALQRAEVRKRMLQQQAHESIRDITDILAASTPRVLEAAASAAASAWIEKRNASAAAAAARGAIIRETGIALNGVRRAVDEARGVRQGDAVNEAAAVPDSAAETGAGTGNRRLPPVFDAEFLNRLPDLSAPRILGAPRRVLAERRLSEIRPELEADLHRHAARLYAWGEQALKETAEAAPTATGTAQIQRASADELAAVDALIDEQAGAPRSGDLSARV